MKKIETIFIIAMFILLIISIISFMPQYYFIFLFLLAVGIIFTVILIIAKYQERYENKNISMIGFAVGIVLLIIYIINMNFPNLIKNSIINDNLLIGLLLIIAMGIGWFFKKNKEES